MEKITQKLSVSTNTASYNAVDVLAEIYEDVEILASLGHVEGRLNNYEVNINYKSSKALGRCARLYPRNYRITISYNHLRYSEPREVHNTIMHEVIHSMDNCMNHGLEWKNIAHQVNTVYDFAPISRVADTHGPEYEEYVKHAYKYSITCQGCGANWRYMRKCSTVTTVLKGRGRCSCGSENFIVHINTEDEEVINAAEIHK